MKIALTSDLHLEFGDFTLNNDENADVLILAGDITVAEDLHTFTRDDVALPHESKRGISAQRYRAFFDDVSKKFDRILYVAGNHEFYHGKWQRALETLEQEVTLNYGNITFLENEKIRIDDTLFLGATMWTNCNNHDPVTMQCLQYAMNDYRTITNDTKGFTKLRPVHTIERHAYSREYFRRHMEGEDKVVIISHHAPTFKSISIDYVSEPELNGGYASDLSEFILDHPQIRVWCHGHMHDEFDYDVGTTKVLCNPLGYPGQRPQWKLKYFEV